MSLKTFIKQLPKEEREPLAKRCGTTWGYIKLVASNGRPCPGWLAVALDRESGGKLKYRELCPPPKIDWDYVERQGALKAAA